MQVLSSDHWKKAACLVTGNNIIPNMQVHSIISNTISEEVLQAGHLSIRFRTDGFSLLLEDSNFNPVILNKFSNDPFLSLSGHIQACENWLNTHTLMAEFSGETTLIVETPAANLIPEKLFSVDNKDIYVEQTNTIGANETVHFRSVKNRPFVIVYPVPNLIIDFSTRMRSECKIMHPLESMLSAADQVDASNHQRGFVMIEAQDTTLEILVIQMDEVVLTNRYKLKSTDEIVYYTLNSFKQLELDRKTIPVYISGVYKEDHAAIKLLGRYIKNVRSMPYFICDIEKESISESIILSEASKCE
jgi:hypothetical protein